MAFRIGDNSTIIGSTTARANGDRSKLILPDNLEVGFTGFGCYYPDGTPTQRAGIIPDIWVEPTIEGIRAGRDELLEMAISIINKEE